MKAEEKWKIKTLGDKKNKRLVQKIEKLINIRNNFAHGTLEYDKVQGYLVYHEGTKQKEKALTKEYITEITEDFKMASHELLLIKIKFME